MAGTNYPLDRTEAGCTEAIEITIASGTAYETVAIPMGMTHVYVVCDVALDTGGTTLQPVLSVDGGTTYTNLSVDMEARSYPETVGAAVPTSPKTFRVIPTGYTGTANCPVRFGLQASTAQTGSTAYVAAGK